MKKLTQLFLSLMLVLGMGTAFADVVSPTFTPGSGSTVAPGQVIKIGIMSDYTGVNPILIWTFGTKSLNDFTFPDDFDDIYAGVYKGVEMSMCQSISIGADGDDVEGVVVANWLPDVVVPDDAQGQVTFQACLFVNGETSEIVTVTYTVEGEVIEIPAPVFRPVEGAVEAGTMVELSVEPAEGAAIHYIAYVINNEDVNFNQYMGDAKVPSGMMYPTTGASPIVIDEAKTVTAATYKFDIARDKIVGWSEKVTVSYTVLTPPAAPTFYPAAGAVAQGTKIEIRGGNASRNVFPYYVIGGTDEDFNLTYEQLKGENNLTKYDDEHMPEVTGEMTIKAAMARVNETNHTVVWSTSVSTATYTAVERPDAPTFSPDGGAVAEGDKVVLTNGTEGTATPLAIYYNTKADASAFGTVTTQAQLTSALQSGWSQKLWSYPEGGIAITKATPIHAATAKIVGNNVIWSEVITKQFTIEGEDPVVSETPVAPTFSPDGGEIEADADITITTECASCKIYYSEYNDEFVNYETQDALDEAANNNAAIFHEYSNGAKPSLSDMDVETPGSSLSLSAAAVKIAADGTLTWSEVTTKEFTVKAGEDPVVAVATPVITPANDAIVRMGAMVTITCATEDAEIYYTSDGSAPYTADASGVAAKAIRYTGPFALTQDMLKKAGDVYELRIRAVATKGGAISTGAAVGYVVYPNEPVFSIPSGEEVREGREVAIACIPTQATIYYTTDASEPTMETGIKYTAPIVITNDVVIRARAVLGQYQSSVVPAAYTVREADPYEVILSFDPASGTEVEEGTEVSIAASRKVDIFYMMFSSAAEAYAAAWNQEEAEAYSEETKPVLSAEKPVIKAAYIRQDEEEIDNEFFYATYTVNKKSVLDTVKIPTFSVAAGEVAKGTKVEIACETEDAVIYYTVDGSEPTAESTEYTAAISIDSAMTIKAIAVKEGMENSKIAEAAYTIKEETANEGLELQGVSIYPNPNGGVFYIELPVDATVEVFATSGMLCQRMNVAAGKTELTSGQSGIYFVRITGEGRSTVKRVIVR